MHASFDPALLWDWLAARSVARGLPLPVPDRACMRVDTGLAEETRRYVFTGPDPHIEALAASIRTPRTLIKMCGPGERLRAMAPSGWQLQPGGHFMTQAGAGGVQAPLAPGYRIAVSESGPVIAVSIHAGDGVVAASGYAVEYGGVFVFDRIATHPDHRRRGLGRALMTALGAMQRSGSTTRVLVATEEGRRLYMSLGWTVLSPFSTIASPERDD